MDVKILDATSGKWLGRWDAYFKGLGIHFLRSPSFFHPSPKNQDALLAFGQGRKEGEGKEGEDWVEIKGVVGKELSKHSRKKLFGRSKNGG